MAALGLIGATAAGLLDVAKKWPNSLSTVPMAFFDALLPAAAHVDAASSPEDRVANLRALYLSSSRYSNLCTAAFIGGHRVLGQPHVACLAGRGVARGSARWSPLFVVFSPGHAIAYAHRPGDFDVSRHGTGVRGVHLLDSQRAAAGRHVAGGALDRGPLDAVRHRRGRFAWRLWFRHASCWAECCLC